MTPKSNKIPPIIYLLLLILTGGFGIYWFFSQKQNFSFTTENYVNLQDIPAVPAGVIKYSGSGDWASIKREIDPVIAKKWPQYQLNYVLPAIVTPTTATAVEIYHCHCGRNVIGWQNSLYTS